MQDNQFIYFLHATETYLEPSSTFMMELFCKNSKLLIIFVKTLYY